MERGSPPAGLGGAVGEAIAALAAMPAARARDLHADHLNPTFVEALGLLGFGRGFARAEGMSLYDERGAEVLDFLAGYGAVPLGHNHPDVRAAVAAALAAGLPSFVPVAPQPLAAAAAARLGQLAPGGLSMVSFASGGAEAVEGALKLARAVTGRARFVSAEGSFHGASLGALSVTGDRRYRAPFEPLLPGCARVPWGDAAAVERELRRRDVAAVILEPLQAEGGIRLPPAGYLGDVARLCRRYGTLFVADEIQTGLGRTGRLFAVEHDGVEPDVVVLAKGLSGGLVPVAATLTRRDLWRRAYGSLERHDIHCSTFAGGPLAAAAALATLEVIERDGLVARARDLGAVLGQRLRAVTAGHPLCAEVRGRGLLWGIELAAPGGALGAELAGQWLAVGLLERGVLTQTCGGAPGVVRAEPPLVVERAHVDRFVTALRLTLAEHAPGAVSSLARAAGRLLKNAAATGTTAAAPARTTPPPTASPSAATPVPAGRTEVAP
jgi:putrescine aminotransferase